MAMYTRNKAGKLVKLQVPMLRGPQGFQGLPGKDGANGKDGITPDIQIGKVTTLEPGQKATVTKRGTKENPVFDFGIPRGLNGKDGKDGQSLISKDTLVTTEIIDNTLTLTADKYQTTTMKDGTSVVLPNVDEFTEIHLFFSTTSELTITLPNIKWQTQPIIKANKSYELIFTYTTKWFGGYTEYSEEREFDRKTEPVMDGLVCWLEAKDLQVNPNNMISNNATWRNRVKGGVDAIIKTITGEDAQCKDGGYFRTNRQAYVILPSFAAKDTNGISVYVDGKINQRPNEQYSKAFLLSYGGHFAQQISLTCGTSEFGHVRNFGEKPSTSLVGNINTVYPIPMKVGVSVGGDAFSPGYGVAKNYQNNAVINFLSAQRYNHEFTTNFLSAETLTTQNKGDFSYGLVLMYDRALTEEEMQHNYEYSLTIRRG